MGLDIGVYNKLEGKTTSLDRDSDEYYNEGFLPLWHNPDFPGRGEGLDPQLAYIGKRVLGFNAGSYSGYGQWREKLAKLAGYPAILRKNYEGLQYESYATGAWEAEGGPFWELINFSDCEGIIGPVVSAKLAGDFQQFQKQADAQLTDYDRERYNSWRKAFELAADNGVVRFG